jgi:hypothetical protein
MAQSERYQRINQYLLVVAIFNQEGVKAIEHDRGVLVYFDTLIVETTEVINVLRRREIEFLFTYTEIRQPGLNGVLITSKY